MRKLTIIIICLLVTSCVQSNVETFSDLPSDYKGKTIAVLPFDKEKFGSLEFNNYKSKLASHFREKGFTIVSPKAEPHYIAFLGYAIDQGRDVLTSYSIPQYGVTGYSGAHTTGTITTYGRTGTYSGTTTLIPQYGITGYRSGTYMRRIFTRSMAIKILDVKQNKEVWSMQLSSSGKCGLMRLVFEPMLEAAFSKFPNTQGKVSIGFKNIGSC